MLRIIATLLCLLVVSGCTAFLLKMKHKEGDEYLSLIPLYVVDSSTLSCPYRTELNDEYYEKIKSIPSSKIDIGEFHNNIELVSLPDLFQGDEGRLELIPIGSTLELSEYRSWRESGWNTGSYSGFTVKFRYESKKSGELILNASEFNLYRPGEFMHCINSIESIKAFRKK